jgi:hypothetical protein
MHRSGRPTMRVQPSGVWTVTAMVGVRRDAVWNRFGLSKRLLMQRNWPPVRRLISKLTSNTLVTHSLELSTFEGSTQAIHVQIRERVAHTACSALLPCLLCGTCGS